MIITSFWDGIIINDTQGTINSTDACQWPNWGGFQYLLGKYLTYYIYVGY